MTTNERIIDALLEGKAFEANCGHHHIRIYEHELSIDGWKYLCYEVRNGHPCIGVNLSFNMSDAAMARYRIASLFFSPDIVRHIGEERRKVAAEPEGLGMTVMYIPLEKPLMSGQRAFTIDDLWGEL